MIAESNHVFVFLVQQFDYETFVIFGKLENSKKNLVMTSYAIHSNPVITNQQGIGVTMHLGTLHCNKYLQLLVFKHSV